MAEPITSSPDAALVTARAPKLAYYSPVSFLRGIDLATQQAQYGSGAVARFGGAVHEEVVPMQGGATGQWLLQQLPWDTSFFGTATYKLVTGLFPAEANPQLLAAAAHRLRQQLSERGTYYAFSLVPAEDVQMLQALSGGGWHLVETRLNFYRPTAEPLPLPPAPVRLAQPAEAAHIGQVSAAARNDFDRFHADAWFGERADALLARYAEAAVEGNYADAVLVPAEPGLAIDSFLAIGDTPAELANSGTGYSRVLLTAVGPANRGWHLRLVAETVRRAAALNLDYVVMTTQATNRAVFRTCEKLGFRLGSTTHVLACYAA